MKMSQDYILPRHLGQQCTETVYLNVVSHKAATDIMNYGLQDLSQNCHTDVVLVTDIGEKIGFHAFVLTCASPVIKSLLSSIFSFKEKHCIHISETSSVCIQHLRSLLYGYSVTMTNKEIDDLMGLNQLLGIQLKLSVSPSSTEMEVSHQLMRLSNKNHPHPPFPPPSSHHVVPQHHPSALQHISHNGMRGVMTRTILGQIEITRNHDSAAGGSQYSAGPSVPVQMPASSRVPDNRTNNAMVLTQPNHFLPQDTAIDHSAIHQLRTQDNYLSSVVIEKQTPEKKRNRVGKSINNVTEFLHKSSNPPIESAGRTRRKKLTYLTSRNQNEDITTNVQHYSYQHQSTNETIDDIVRNRMSHATLVPRSGQEQSNEPHHEESSIIINQHPEASYQTGASTVENKQVASKSQGTIEQPAEDQLSLESNNTPDRAAVVTNSSYVGDKEIENIQLPECFQQEETVNTLGTTSIEKQKEDLPLLCWFCSQEFESFQSLCDHINTHSGSNKFSRRHHRCPRCGEVLHSTWKLRQHLTTHHTEKKDKLEEKSDHQYAERPSRSSTTKKHKGDHGYATLSECRTLDQESSTNKTNQMITDTPQMTDNNQNTDENIPKDSEENQNNTCKNGESEENNAMTESNGDVKNVNISQADDLRVQVSHEHSYGTKRDSSPETDQCISDEMDKTDHAYSTAHASTKHSPTNNSAANKNSPTKQLDASSIRGRKRGSQDDAAVSSQMAAEEEAAIMLRKKRNFRRTKLKKANSFPCAKCTKTFPQKYRLTRHIREVHDKEKQFKCDTCPSQFFKSSSLFRHKVSVHLDFRPYNCQHCTASFKDAKALKYHEENNVCDSMNYSLKLYTNTI